MRFAKKRLYRLNLDGKSDVDTVENLSERYGLLKTTIMTYAQGTKYKHPTITVERTDKYVHIAYMGEDDIIPYKPPKVKIKKEKKESYFDVMMEHLRVYGNVALPDGEKNPARWLPELYDQGLNCKINTYAENGKEYYTIWVV